jgi:predicted SprT family Zn-dependent metalloprotease
MPAPPWRSLEWRITPDDGFASTTYAATAGFGLFPLPDSHSTRRAARGIPGRPPFLAKQESPRPAVLHFVPARKRVRRPSRPADYRHRAAYFAGGRFGSKDGQEVTDEIALNPSHFRDRSTEQSLSTLVHEMTHLEQHHFGKPSRAGYHNKQWAGMMKAVGLIPSDTGAPGGRKVGQKVSHYIEAGGAFERACAELVKGGFNPLYVELWTEAEKKARKAKSASKTRYTCPQCQTNAWAKPDVKLICGACDARMLAGDDHGDAGTGATTPDLDQGAGK